MHLARRFAERLLGIEISKLEFFEVEMDVPAALRKSVRMDAVLVGSGQVVEIEMQTDRDSSLERKLRYYQAMIDARSPEKGKKYKELPELYMLAVCRCDHTGTDTALHRFELRSSEDPTLSFDNGVHVVIVNTSASMAGMPSKVRSLLEYIETNEPVEGDDLTIELADATREADSDEGWVGSIMTVDMMMDIREGEALEKGIAQGHEQGLEQGHKESEARSNALIEAMKQAGASGGDILAALTGDDRQLLYEQYGV